MDAGRQLILEYNLKENILKKKKNGTKKREENLLEK